ncbi:MAG: putative baseplate assembly protein [Deltaproteobacteria bacterium]|nr:putative baseplate assembly protein [Deltaproteobacteria bacterium]
MIYFCCEEPRRIAVNRHPSLNGIDFLEVVDSPELALEERQRTLLVYFVKPLTVALSSKNIKIEGGERLRDIRLAGEPTIAGNLLTLKVVSPGDFSTYTLRLVRDAAEAQPPAGIDPVLASVNFSFKVNCPSDFDCQKLRQCPEDFQPGPEINYLAKDYGSFRQAMLDRLAVLAPRWRERNPADLGVALVEMLAYVGDHLSYQQDAVATEAYLGTARRRVSLRRHARLVDYHLHEGCNARVWVQVQVGVEELDLAEGVPLSTSLPGEARSVVTPATLARLLPVQQPEVFETMHPVTLRQEHNTLSFYTWGARECCLPQNSTRATLSGHLPHLKAGDALILAEVVGPRTGRVEDADPDRRHAVRLNHVWLSQDPLGGLLQEPPHHQPVDVTEVSWMPEDALPFPLCLSSRTDPDHGHRYLSEVSLAYGNIVLADHGLTQTAESLGAVPEPALFLPPDASGQRCQEQPATPVPVRFRPFLKEKPLTRWTPYEDKVLFSLPGNPQQEADLNAGLIPDELELAFLQQGITFRQAAVSVRGGHGIWSISDGLAAGIIKKEDGHFAAYHLPPSATAIIRRSVATAMPAITLRCHNTLAPPWEPRRDLLASQAADHHFVVETENDGTSLIRFGDGRHGRRPAAGTAFTATYRVGNGRRGNVGRQAIAHLVSDDPGLLSAVPKVCNPLPASGGMEPEALAEVRRDAPQAFRIQERAVTPEDYVLVAQRHPGVQKAAATFRWTGSWHTVFVTIDRQGGKVVDDAFKDEMRRHLEKYRLAGHDLEINGPLLVPLEIDLLVCVKPNYFRGDVRAALLEVFSNRILAGNRLGVFHPDNFSFGQPVFLSPLYAAAQSVPGVNWVRVTKFQRQGRDSTVALEVGKLELGRLEIACLDNDPNFPERGVLRLNMQGGK